MVLEPNNTNPSSLSSSVEEELSADTPPPVKRPLPERREMFCQHYLTTNFNASEAARRAGYSEKTAGAIGHELLKFPEIRARVEELKAARVARVQVEQDDVLRELIVMMKSSIADYEHDTRTGKLAVRDNINPDAIRAVSSIKHRTRTYKQGEEHELEIRLWDKSKAVEMGMKHLGLMVDRLKVEAPEKVLADVLGVDEKELPE